MAVSFVLKLFLFPIIKAVQFKWSVGLNYVWVSDPMTWENAEQFCVTTFQTHLASIHDGTQNGAVANLCSSGVGNSHCFIGLNDRANEGQWSWTDDTNLDYGPNWYGSNPGDTGNPDEDCVGVLPSSGWGDHFCTAVSIYTFICNAPTEIFIFSENNNYIWVGPQSVSWNNAELFCNTQFNTSLASIHSVEENNELANLCNSLSMGLNVHCSIGLNDKAAEGAYAWTDGSVVDFGIPGNWNPPDPSNSLHAGVPEGEDCGVAVEGTTRWGDIPCYGGFDYPFICNAPLSCAELNSTEYIDWDKIVNDVNNEEIPYYNVNLTVNVDELSVDIDVDLAYLGNSYADNGMYGFGTTYFISLNSFSSNTLDIFSDGGLSQCDNRLSSSFIGKTFAEKWEYSEYPYLNNHIGSDSYLAYPPPGQHWDLNVIDKCGGINYFASFSWSDLQNNCNNPQTNQGSVVIVVDDDWMNLTGTFYISIVSPLSKNIDSGNYRIYELTNEQFTIAISKSIHVLGSTGISLFKLSIISVNTEGDIFKLNALTEAADYLKLTTATLLINPSGYQFNIEALNNGDCLSFKSNICVQTWQISTRHNQTCNDFGGIYGIQWIAICNPDVANNTQCVAYNGDTISLSVETTYEDATCDQEIGKVQFEGQLSFYTNDSFTGNVGNDYKFIVGEDMIYVEVELNYPPNTYSIFDSKLINVWICSIDDQVYGATFTVSQTNPSNTGCLSSMIDNDGYNPYWIIQNFDQIFEQNAMHINNTINSNIVRFSFQTPYTLTRDTLWVHTQIEVSLIGNVRRRALLDTKTSGRMRHFISSVNVENVVVDDDVGTIQSTKANEETDDVVMKPTWLVLTINLYFVSFFVVFF